MLDFKIYASGSSGNLYTLSSAKSKIIIECGLSFKQMQKCLDYKMSEYGGVLLTHDHISDHAKAAKDCIGSGLDLYCSYGTATSLGVIGHHRVHVVEHGKPFDVDSMMVVPFNTVHDASEPLGFYVMDDDEAMLFATDTGNIEHTFGTPPSIVSLECSYDYDVIEAKKQRSEINESLANRLLSSHFSKQNLMLYLTKHLDMSKCRELNLLHLSKSNIDWDKTKKEFEDEFLITVKLVGD